jgi:uncharacterized protein (DUF4213/DUF364 family)
MKMLAEILETLPDGEVEEVRIGLHWTAVVVNVNGEQRCGLASTLVGGHDHHKEADVPQAGELEGISGRELARLALGNAPTQASVGMAALNALLPRRPQTWVDANAEEMIAAHGKGKRVAMIGHFPFVPRLRTRVKELLVLEQNPRDGDLPAESAAKVLPMVDVAAITGMTFLNHTLEILLGLCQPQAFVIVMGPSTPLSPLLFDHGIDVVSGSIVVDIQPVLKVVSQGGNFRQVHQAGVRLVNILKP